MPYRFKKERKYRPDPVPRKKDGPEDSQEYYLHGKKVSDLEYFYGTALEKRNKEFIVKYLVRMPQTIPGQEKEIDFVVEKIHPREIDGEFSHKSAEQRAEDKARDAQLDEYLKQKGFKPIKRIPGKLVDTQEKADAYVQENE